MAFRLLSLRLDPALGALLSSMEASASLAYQSAALAARRGLGDGTLGGMLFSRDRWRLLALVPGAHPAACEGGALFQCIERRSPPRAPSDLVGWVLVADDYQGGSLVLAHEIAHYRNRLEVALLAQQKAPLVHPTMGEGSAPGWLRATFVNEVAARHTAYLGHAAARPEIEMPAPGALFGCAVTIARYPEVYGDTGPMARLLALGDEDLLRDQVGLWLQGLERFSFFEPGTAADAAHRAYLEREVRLASAGRAAPRVVAEGTL
jgi:hypothetical protein